MEEECNFFSLRPYFQPRVNEGCLCSPRHRFTFSSCCCIGLAAALVQGNAALWSRGQMLNSRLTVLKPGVLPSVAGTTLVFCSSELPDVQQSSQKPLHTPRKVEFMCLHAQKLSNVGIYDLAAMPGFTVAPQC